jgi:hypothetical protein
MMGGLGSGRPSGSGRDTVESCRSIDVNRLQKACGLSPGWSSGWQWTRDGEKVAWISLRAEASCLNLTYRVRVADGEWRDVVETVRIVRIPCRFGGARPYFICPGVVNGIACGRRHERPRRRRSTERALAMHAGLLRQHAARITNAPNWGSTRFIQIGKCSRAAFRLTRNLKAALAVAA